MFNYTCEECGQGTVRENIFRNYQTKIKGYSFVVEEARIGVCDRCQAKHFNSQETKRWEQLYEQQLEKNDIYLSPSDIVGIRESLGLTIEGLAYLIGCTRQSIYNWEKMDRTKPQSRMADLLLRLVRDSAQYGETKVNDFLVEQARRLGVNINLTGKVLPSNIIRLKTKSVLEEYLKQSSIWEPRLAAADRERKVVVAESPKQDIIGLLHYDYVKANLSLNIIKDTIGLQVVDVTVVTLEEQKCTRESVEVKDGEILLVAEAGIFESDIKEIILEKREAK